MSCFSSYTIYLPFTFHKPSNSNNNESLLLLFWRPLESEDPVYYYHVTYAFQSEYTLCSFLNFKERLPRNRCDIWSLSKYRTDEYLQQNQSFDHFDKMVDWLWVIVGLNTFAVTYSIVFKCFR